MRINEDFIKTDMGKEVILIPLGNKGKYKNGVFDLNETGEKIYDLLEAGKNADEIVDILAAEYSDDRAVIAGYVDEFIAKLLEAKILIDD